MNKKLLTLIGTCVLSVAVAGSAIAATSTTDTSSSTLTTTTKDGEKPERKELVDTSSWTDAQKELLNTAMNQENDEATRKAALDSLVSAGLITQEEADRLLEGPKGMDGKGGGMVDTSSWTDAQKELLNTAMNQENDEATRKAALDSLVSAGLITQEEADRFLEGPKDSGKGPGSQGKSGTEKADTSSTTA